MNAPPMVEVRGLTRHYEVRGALGGGRAVVRALEDTDLSIEEGSTLGVIGESGSGKSTLARCLLRLEEPTAGTARIAGLDVHALRGRRQMLALRRTAQMVFQDPAASLDPRQRIGSILTEPLRIHRLTPRDQQPARVRTLLEQVGLPPEVLRRFPHELSGGQKQRVGIARALAVEPRFIVADEPTSALDVSVQAQIVNLIVELQQRLGLTLLVIAHDLHLVSRLSERVAVMYLGRIVEEASPAELFSAPRHPYTRLLIESAPALLPWERRAREPRPGEAPSPIAVPAGCAFHPRCAFATEQCRKDRPPLASIPGGRRVACWEHERMAGP